MRIISVVGARPNFMKIAPFCHAIARYNLNATEKIEHLLVHTGQHYDDKMSSAFFEALNIPAADINLGIGSGSHAEQVGNIMIDTLMAQKDKAAALDLNQVVTANLYDKAQKAVKITDEAFAVMTMHRPSNVDAKEILEPIINFLIDEVASDMPLLWPTHPRARKQLELFSLWDKVRACSNLILMQPLGYHDLLRLNMGAKIMLTDSGGLQEECCILGTPCLTLRWNTERPVTLREHGGASVLVGNNVERIRDEYRKTLIMERNRYVPNIWDGHTAERIVKAITKSSMPLQTILRGNVAPLCR